MPANVRLSALHGTPLDDFKTRETVEATARAIAEREGVALTAIKLSPTDITVTLECDRIAGVGFAAELRRVTNTWYEEKYRDGPLWGTPAPGTEFQFE